MTAATTTVTPEKLLAHRDWMRGLARSLVRDENQADDVIQQIWVDTLQTPPTKVRSIKAWLATVVRNRVRQLYRGESRRRQRQRTAARPERVPAAADVVAHAEAHQRVVRAVLDLEEPYRTTVLLRFYEELPPREVAAQMGVPVETVRTRVRRALAQLRRTMDREHGGDRRAWIVTLLPLTQIRTPLATGGGAASGWTGAMTMAANTKIVAGVVVGVMLGAVTAWLASGAGGLEADLEEARTELADTNAALTVEKKTTEKLRHTLSERDEHIKMIAKELDAQRERAEELAAEAKDLNAKLAALGPEAEDAVADHEEQAAHRFKFHEYDEALASVDWNSVGEHMSALIPIIQELVESMESGTEMSPERIGEIQQHNGPLVAAAIAIMKDIPGTGANGSFTHPAFMSNAMAATLDRLGMSLTDEQASALEVVARRYSDADRERTEGYDERTIGLAETIGEAKVRSEFLDAAFATLTEEQRKALKPDSVAGIMSGDLFSEGLLWATVTKPIRHNGRDDIARKMGSELSQRLGVSGDTDEAVRRIVQEWADTLPVEVVEHEATGMENYRFAPVDVVERGAQQTLALLERLQREAGLTDAEAERLRNIRSTAAFFKETGGEEKSPFPR